MKVAFKNGTLKLNPDTEHEKKAAIFLAFSKSNADHINYDVICNALPRIKGLKRKSTRAFFAFKIVEKIFEQGYEIKKTTP